MTTNRAATKRITLRLMAIVILLAVGFATVAVVTGVRTSLEAERNLHAVLNTISACQTYVNTNDGQWPNSWGDIDTLMPDQRDWGVHDRVTVDFDADPCALATQDSHHFTGIVVDSPVYIHEREIDSLLETLRRYHPAISDDG